MHQIHPASVEALQAIEGVISAVVETHEANQTLWLPSQLVSKEYVPPELPPELVGMLTLNLLTEDGLPYFMGLLVKHLGDQGAIWSWNRMWTAEEDRHGAAIKRYLNRALTDEQMVQVELMQYRYLRDGFWPEWSNDPFKLLAYVVLQEKATWQSHASIAQLAAKSGERVLVKLMGKVAGEEEKHHQAYLTMFQALAEINPSHALTSLLHVVRHFAMPGSSIPGFRELSTLQQRLNAFGPKQFHDIVKLVWDTMNIGTMRQLDGSGEQARETLFKKMSQLNKVAERAGNQKPEIIPITFLGKNVTVIA